jgi:hypothetical protein
MKKNEEKETRKKGSQALAGFRGKLTLSTNTVPKFPTMLMIPKTRPPVLIMVR